ncbi:MAG: low molecular weight protein arginine phosphatase [Chloroflexi bacterium]|nr:low molecular weight protein arginine phosphatase [Chloroflexota bacterium]
MPSILFICTANQCRSPMAQVMLAAKVAALNQSEAWIIGSAGTSAAEGIMATPLARQVMARKGLDLEPHRSRGVTASLLESADLIFTMTRNHREALCIEFPQFEHKIHLLSELIDQTFDIDDPVGGDEEDYRLCADEMGQIIEKGFQRIIAWVR